MTYDQWKTTDPCELRTEDEDHATELELVYDELHKVYDELHEARTNARYAEAASAARIKKLEDELRNARAYIECDMDIIDGSDGPRPNVAMSLVSSINETLYGPGNF